MGLDKDRIRDPGSSVGPVPTALRAPGLLINHSGISHKSKTIIATDYSHREIA